MALIYNRHKETAYSCVREGTHTEGAANGRACTPAATRISDVLLLTAMGPQSIISSQAQLHRSVPSIEYSNTISHKPIV